MFVIPAKAGTQQNAFWAPAFAGVTKLLMLVALLLAFPAVTQDLPARGNSPVVDQANLLRPEQVLDLTSKSEALLAQTGVAFVVVTVNSLGGQEIEPYATALFRAWEIGDKERDDGILLLVAPNERKVRIETGYGAEGVLPDILAGRIVRNDILPKFREGDMGGGIVAGADAIIAQLQLPPEEARQRAEQAAASARRADVDVNPLPVIFMVVIFFVIIGSIAKRAGGRRYRGRGGKRGRGLDSGDLAILLWGLNALGSASRGRGGWGGGGFGGFGGGGGGGFGGFGGGSSGGGGASGSW